MTEARPRVVAVHASAALEDAQALALAADVEHRQSHPIADAIRRAAEADGWTAHPPDAVRVTPGFGISGEVRGAEVHVGSSRRLHRMGCDRAPGAGAITDRIRAQGGQWVHVAVDGVEVAVIELAAQTRPEAAEVVAMLQAQGRRVLIVSGDDEAPTRTLAESLGVDGYHARILPEGKSQIIKSLQADGHRVAFVGDGINDAIALEQANLSISLEGATSIAQDTAQVLMCTPRTTPTWCGV